MTAAPWDERHRREALRRTYEIAAEMVGRGEPNGPTNGKRPAFHLATDVEATDEEATWRQILVHIRMPPARVDREARRVRALAEGRLVRETTERFEVFRGAASAADSAESWEVARAYAAERNGWLDKLRSKGDRYRAVRVRITRIRRA